MTLDLAAGKPICSGATISSVSAAIYTLPRRLPPAAAPAKREWCGVGQLADMTGVSRQTIVAIEGGDYAPSVKLALLLAKKLETSVEELFILEEKDDV